MPWAIRLCEDKTTKTKRADLTGCGRGTVAVKGGVEPPCCDSVVDKIAGFVVNPYSITCFKFSALETRGCVCRAYAFHHLTVFISVPKLVPSLKPKK